MAIPHSPQPNLPEYMTWEDLELLPTEIAQQIELWNGKVIWVRRGPAEHQDYSAEFRSALRRSARDDMGNHTDRCWRVSLETNVFFGDSGKSDFVTPDFLVYRCLEAPYSDIRARDVVLVGEVHSPSNTQTDIEAKKARYAQAGIPYYWEVDLARPAPAIGVVRSFALETGHGQLPDGVRPLRSANYVVTGEWTPADQPDGIITEFPFPIRIPWADLEI
ncbi:Uma2 family endonuclease [Nocardia sp. NPDC050712]|uniref:Uma2 family endonuclease n=1 Tax=Nocardia sp. NPDC050712 TaxID=3155518 RepID=UPI0033FE76E7